MNRYLAAAITACALFCATSASAGINLLDRQIVTKNGTPIGTLYLVIDTDQGAKDDVFAVMDDPAMSFPPPMDFVVLAPAEVGGGLQGDEPLRAVNNWKVREQAILHKGVAAEGECNTIYQSLYQVAPVTVVNGIYRPTNEFVALMGEQNACANEGRLRWFVDAAQHPANTRPMPDDDDLYFEAIGEFGPAVAAHTWYSRTWLPEQ